MHGWDNFLFKQFDEKYLSFIKTVQRFEVGKIF